MAVTTQICLLQEMAFKTKIIIQEMQFDSRCSSQQVEKRVRMGGGDGR
jgi:hypothetical protein